MIEILGGEKKKEKSSAPADVKNGAAWKIKVLENAFQFYLDEYPDKELFLEYDELKAVGKAYELSEPLNILDVLQRLETLNPGFEIIDSGVATLTRKHFEDSSGLLVERNGSGVFMKDKTLQTINFLDFHDDFLNTETKLLSEEQEHE